MPCTAHTSAQPARPCGACSCGGSAASLTPARVIGVDGAKGSLAAGKDADLAVFSPDLTPLETVIAGRTVARGLEGATP